MIGYPDRTSLVYPSFVRGPRWHFPKTEPYGVVAACSGGRIDLDKGRPPEAVPSDARCTAFGCRQQWEEHKPLTGKRKRMHRTADALRHLLDHPTATEDLTDDERDHARILCGRLYELVNRTPREPAPETVVIDFPGDTDG